MTRMKMAVTSALAALMLALTGAEVLAGWGVGVRIGGPVYYRPWDPYYYPYYPYRAVYVAPQPVAVESAPLVVQPAPGLQPVSQAASSPLSPPTVAQPVAGVQPASASSAVHARVQEAPQTEINHYLQQLRDPDERVRADSVLQLGRVKAMAAVDPLAATLAGDRSPMVREAAARALGLIGSPKALPALQRAALADPNRDVRHSAQFAVDIVQSGR